MVIWFIEGQESPARYQASYITKHNTCPYGSSSGCVADDVGADLGVAESAVSKGTGSDEESCAISDMRGIFIGSEEHDVTDHDKRGTNEQEDIAAIESPGEKGEKQGEECADHVRWNCVELLGDDGVVWINCLDNRWSKECEP